MGGFAGVRMSGISKSFGGNYANRDVDFAVAPGEIVGLLGENGAGKTTLMNVLYGLYHPEAGHITLGDQTIRMDSPRDAIRHGIGMVHQHFMLVQNQSVAENVALGYEKAPFFFPRRVVSEKLKEFGKIFGLQVDPNAMVWQL
ncbi:MAG: ATP-binding cassette domain-containing protein, partial [Treponemataceae bacterium]